MTEADARNAGQIDVWNGSSGEQWVLQQERMDAVLAPVSSALFAVADVQPGMHVLDIGCGCGDTTLEIARRVGSAGRVLGVDISVPMLARARERTPAGAPVAFIEADATTYALPAADADLLLSRFGVMFFADPVAAFANMRQGLKSGGRVAFACWRPIETCPWMTVPLKAARSIVPADPNAPPADPDAPGPQAFARAERVQSILAAAGFADIALDAVDLTVDLAGGKGLTGAIEGALYVGPVSRVMRDQPPDVKARATDALRTALTPYVRGETVPLGAGIWIVTARNP